MKRFLIALLCLAPVAALTQSLDAYLKTRAEHGIAQASSAAALETFVGNKVLEVSGTLKGSVGNVVILDNPEGQQPYYVKMPSGVPDWAKIGTPKVRMIVEAERSGEFARTEMTLLGIAMEEQVAKYEAAPAPRPAAKTTAPPKSTPQTSRTGRNVSTPASRGGSRSVNVVTGGVGTQTNLAPSIAALVPTYAAFMRQRNKRLSVAQSTKIAEELLGFSVHYGVDARLVMALVMAESNFNPKARSHAGARGLGQLMPGTARELGVSNSYDIEQNLSGTVKLLRKHIDKYTASTGDTLTGLIHALAAYNAGPGNVRKYGGVPPFRETQNYVKKVIDYYHMLTGKPRG